MPRRGRREYRFQIDVFSPETMPMERLAAYLHDLAILFGEPSSVHLIRVEAGSTVPVILVDHEAEPKVRSRLRSVRRKDGPPEAIKAAAEIDHRLERDNAKGTIIDPVGAKVIEFPGRERASLPEYGPFTQSGSLDGIPIRIGGRSDPVPLLLEDGSDMHQCLVKRVMAKAIAAHLFTSIIRVEGMGRWIRHRDGQWELIHFIVSDFRLLKPATLSETIEQLRAIHAQWTSMNDPIEELRRIRYGPDAE